MKKLIIAILCVFCFALPVKAQTDYLSDYKLRELFLISANACLASYDDKVGNIFYAFLANDGWNLQRIEKKAQTADANVFLASLVDEQTGYNIYVLAFRGTATSKDVKLDTQLKKVPFVGDTLEQIQQNALTQVHGEEVPRVHRGFLKYVLVSFDIDVIDAQNQVGNLEDIIKDDPKAKIVITGHSLGGGAAVLYAASLINMGVEPEKISVVTFGAPAVGNKNFADLYKDNMDLTRIYSSYDPVPKVLQTFYAYTQFGKKFVVNSDPRFKTIQHSMENYADLITKDYYNTRFVAIDKGQLPAMPQSVDIGTGAVVALAVTTTKNIYHLSEYRYAKEYLIDIYRDNFWRYRILPVKDGEDDLATTKQLAKESGADYLLVANIDMQPLKEQKAWLISQEQSLYDCSDGKLLSFNFTSHTISKSASFIQAAALNSFNGFAQIGMFELGFRYPNFCFPAY